MKSRKAQMAVLLISALMASACSRETKRQTVVVKEPQAQGITYTTAEAAYADISVTDVIRCTYTQTKTYELSFGIGEHQVQSMDVKKGDLVTEGQLLCSLDVEDMEEKIPQLTHEYEANVLKLQQQRELLEFDKDNALSQDLTEIEKQYRDMIQDLEDAVTISRARLTEAREQVQSGMIYAPVTGEATFVSNLTKGSYSAAGETVVIISDLSTCYFQTDQLEYMEWFKEGETYELRLDIGDAVYDVTPVEREQWEQEGVMQFRLTSDAEFVEIGATGGIAAHLGEKEHALCVPAAALHATEDGCYVYLLADGTRKMQPVRIGLSGEEQIEIVSGLSEHDIVILDQRVGGTDDE